MGSGVVFVTGGSSGIGKGIAEHLAENGYTVYAGARRTERMEDMKEKGVKPIQLDVTKDDAAKKAVDTILEKEGRIDVLVNNAGFGGYGAIEDVSIDDAREQFEVNVLGVARMIKLVLPQMRERRSGKIVNISSIGGKVALPLGGWYHASKFAIEGLSDSLRNEVRQFGVDVVVIEPGGIKSEFVDIAINNLMERSGNGPYKEYANKYADLTNNLSQQSGLPGPEVIAKLVRQAIEAKKPYARYYAGLFAGRMNHAKNILSDSMMDSFIARQFGISTATRPERKDSNNSGSGSTTNKAAKEAAK